MRTPHAEYVNHREFIRLRHSTRFLDWLDAQAARLETTPAIVFGLLQDGFKPVEIEDMGEFATPVNLTVPVVTGVASVGETLTVTEGTWSGDPRPVSTFQWQKGTTDIEGATGRTYVIVSGDAGSTIRCVETATNLEGSASANSVDVGPVPELPANTVLPEITGTAQVGETLTTTDGTWTGTPTPTYARQWEADGEAIAEATGTTYDPVEDDVGKTITVTVTGTNSEGNASATSVGVGPVIAAA